MHWNVRLNFLQAVNQCIGRVIRHRNDWAAIVMADTRWVLPGASNAQMRGKLPGWIQESLHICSHFGDAYSRLTRFCRVMAWAVKCKLSYLIATMFRNISLRAARWAHVLLMRDDTFLLHVWGKTLLPLCWSMHRGFKVQELLVRIANQNENGCGRT